MKIHTPRLLLVAAGFAFYTTMCGLFNLLPWIGKPLMGIFPLSVAFAGPVLVVLSASVEREKLLAACLFLLSGCDVIVGLSSYSSLLIFARLTTALLHPVLFPAALAISIKAVPEEYKRYAVGAAILGILVGVIASISAVTWSASNLAHPSLLLTCAALHAVTACFFYKRKEEKCRKKSLSYQVPLTQSMSSRCMAK
ncbi:MFS transporter [Pseudoduganella sp. FT25W]|uniref:MFS transporter n=1 Tax=Duganella alba TaxID=2666081 RepID=A0A6L5QBL7_9BURK|nr:MFS transporter [Duganella alba]MRX07163.1 MFS transporter [Duganella alba]MRX15142.1 MFS transporter [Duganella alba]